VKVKVVLFVIVFLVWLALSWSVDVQHLVVGAVVALLVTASAAGLFQRSPRLLKRPGRYVYFLFGYVPLFVWEVIKANFDVAYRVLNPVLPIRPGIVKVKTQLKSDLALTFLANSITLTPGTMTVDVDRERGFLYVHWINVKDPDVEAATRIVAGRFEPLLRKIFEPEEEPQ
jgi:multicomponent Na+:H+ antiporter subunit E